MARLRASRGCFALFVSLAAFLLPLARAAADASSRNTGSIAGRIIDEDGHPIPDVNVFVKVVGRGDRSDSTGSYQIRGIPPGIHTIEARLLGFGPEKRTVRVAEKRTTKVDFVLKPVVVSLGPPLEITSSRPTPEERRPPLGTFARRDSFVIYAGEHALTPEEFFADSVKLFGAWTWTQTYGGELGDIGTPLTRRSRILTFHRDGTYAFLERGTAADSVLCAGEFSVHPARQSQIEDGPRACMWVELKHWLDYERDQLIAYPDANTLLMYPGREADGYVTSVSDALKTKFVRSFRSSE